MRKRCNAAGLLLAVLCLLFCACGNSSQAYTSYVQAVLDCTYKGDTAAYCALTRLPAADGEALYREETDYIARLICNQMAVEYDCLSENNRLAYERLAQQLQGKLSYSVESVVETGDAYQVTLTVKPTDFWDICIDDVERLYQAEFSERFGRAEGQEEKLRVIEGVWGARVLRILESHIDEAGYQEPETMQFTIRTDEHGIYNVRSKDWMDLDDRMLDIAAKNG